MTNKWVFKVKLHDNDMFEKFKVKIVVKKFSQMYDIDYTNIFASIVKFDTFRLFLIIVTLENLKCHQVNVNNVFTKSFLQKIIYMTSSSNVDLSLEQTLFIRRNLYELRQTTRDWHKRCVKKLKKFDFEQCVVDFCMLRYKKRDIYLLVYVDDIAIVARTLDQIQWFKNEFNKIFKIKNLKKMKKILDIKITRNRRKRTLRIYWKFKCNFRLSSARDQDSCFSLTSNASHIIKKFDFVLSYTHFHAIIIFTFQ